MVVQPGLEPVDVALCVGLTALSALDRKVGVDPVRSLARLVDDDRADRDRRDHQRGGEAQVDDGDRETTRNPKPAQRPNERVE